MLVPRVCAPRVTRCSLGHVIWSVQLACSILSRSDSCKGDGRQRHLRMQAQYPLPVYYSQIALREWNSERYFFLILFLCLLFLRVESLNVLIWLSSTVPQPVICQFLLHQRYFSRVSCPASAGWIKIFSLNQSDEVLLKQLWLLTNSCLRVSQELVIWTLDNYKTGLTIW